MTAKKNTTSKSYALYWKNAFNFKGRTRRSDYFNFVVINFVIQTVLSLINMIESEQVKILSTVILTIYTVINFIPSISILVRRLHDIGKSGKMILLSLIPIIGQIIIIIYVFKDSEQGANIYGESPKYINNNVEHEKENHQIYCPVCKSVIDNEVCICPKCGSKIESEGMYE